MEIFLCFCKLYLFERQYEKIMVMIDCVTAGVCATSDEPAHKW